MDRQEAIKIVERNWPDGRSALQEALGVLVPELSRSGKDERIRMDICTWLEHKRETCTYPTPKKETLSAWIAYLEKQKEQKPVEYPEKGNEYWFGFNEGKGSVLDHPEEYGLIKPAEWSEEDKLPIDAAIYWLERRLAVEQAHDISTRSCPLSMRETAERLKSLRPQPKQEWSDNDIDARNEIMIILSNSGKIALASWFSKAFSIPHHWKPSKEQMAALLTAVGDEKQTGSNVAEELRILYYDLKKLL